MKTIRFTIFLILTISCTPVSHPSFDQAYKNALLADKWQSIIRNMIIVDISQKSNVEINEALTINQENDVILFSKEGQVIGTAHPYGRSIRKAYSWYHKKGYREDKNTRKINRQLDLYLLSKASSHDEKMKALTIISSTSLDSLSFYECFVGAKLCEFFNDYEGMNAYKKNGTQLYNASVNCPYLLYKLVTLGETNFDVQTLLLKDSADFGDVRQTDGGQCVVPITNIGTKSLIIFQVAVSCRCLSVNYPNKIDPGETKQIVVSMKPGEPLGRFANTIILETNAKKQNIIIPVLGNII